MKGLMLASIGIGAFFVVSVIWTTFKRGLPVLSWEMVSQLPSGGFYLGGKGGFLNAIVGSLYIVGGSTLLGLIIALPVVFYMNVYLKPTSKFGYIARLAYDTLFGIPSIVYGSFAFTVMVWLGIRASLGGGILVTTLLIVPILIRSMDEVAKTIPQEILDSSYSHEDRNHRRGAQTDSSSHRHCHPAKHRQGDRRLRRCDVHSRILRPHPSRTQPAGSHTAAERLLPTKRPTGGCAEQSLRRSRGAHHHRIGIEFRRALRNVSLFKE